MVRVSMLSLAATFVSGRLHGQTWEDMFGPPPGSQDKWTKHFRIGALVGFNFKGQFSITGPTPGASNPGGDGPGLNHTYDDGYVKVDYTGNDDGLTLNWGYQHADQWEGSTLTFHSVQSYETSGSSGGSVDGDAQVGLELAYGGKITRLWGGSLGWEFGFGWMPIDIENELSGSASVTRLVHQYDTGGVLLPQAPYQGSFNGPGPTISDDANDMGTETVGADISGSQKLDLNLFSFRLGPTMQWQLHQRVSVLASAGAAFGIVGGGLKYNETLVYEDLTTSTISGKSSDTEFVYGGYVAGTFLFHIERNGDVYLGFQYMPMSSATFSGNGREGKLDLTGALYISAGVNWPF
jgi:hypothetical protein